MRRVKAKQFQCTASFKVSKMSGNGRADVEGVGILTYQRAIDIARNTEGELDRSVRDYLEEALTAIWGRINVDPDTYLLSRDEFAVFNFFIRRFDGIDIAERAVARYWQHTGQTPGSRR